MTMVICKECKSPISSKTDACLHCGARQRKTPRLTTIAVVLLGATLLTNTALLWRLYQFESQTTPPGAYAATPD